MPDPKEEKRTDGEEPLGSTLKPKIETPDTSLNPNVENTQVLRDNVPEFAAQNPYNIKQRLLSDNKLLEKTANQYFTSQFSDRQWDEMQQDPERLQKNFNLFKKNFRKDLVNSSYAGRTTDETLVDRTLKVTDTAEEIPADQLLQTMRSNKKKYQKQGLIGDDGEPIYGEDKSTFQQELLSNPKLHRQLQQDRYDEFTSELSKSHNNAAMFQSEAEKTKAWMVYNKMGKEGLTEYVNAKQALSGGSITEGFSERIEAAKFLDNVKIGGKSLKDHYKRFVVGNLEGVKYGDIIAEQSYKTGLDPALVAGVVRQESNFNANAQSSVGAIGAMQIMEDTARVDLGIDPSQLTNPETNIRGGTEYLSRLMKRYKGNEQFALAAYNAGMGNVDKAIKKAQSQGGDWKQYLPKPEETVPYIQKVSNYRDEYAGKADRGLVFNPRMKRDDLKKNFPKDLNPYTVDFYDKKGKVKKLKTTIEDYASKYLPKEQAEKFNKSNFSNQGEYSDDYRQLAESVYEKHKTKDLLDTLIANSEVNGKYENGTQYHQIDYNKLDWPQKLAYNALQINPQSDELFREVGDGKYQIIPDYQKLSSDIWGKARSYFYNTTTESYTDENGDIKFRETPDKGWFGQIQNATVNTLFAGAHTMSKYVTTPLAKGVDYIADSDWSRDLKEAQEVLSAGSLSNLSDTKSDGWLPNAAEEVAPFGWYLAGMVYGGGAITKAAGKAMQLATKGKAAFDTGRVAAALSGSSRWAQIGKRLGSVANPTGRLYAGGVAMESLTRDQDSFYNVLPQMAGYDKKNAVSNYYNKANGWTKTAMDALGSLAVDFGFDTLIAGSQFAKQKSAQKWFGENKFESFQMKPVVDGGKVSYKPIMKDTPTFKHEMRKFIGELTNDLAKKPIGNVGESMGKNFLDGTDSINTLHDAVKKWSDDLGGFSTGVKSDIKKNIRSLESRYGSSVRLTDSQLDELAEGQYKNFVDNVGDQMAGIFKTSKDQQLGLKFADALEKQLPTVKEFTVGGKKVRPQQVGFYRDKGKKLVVKDDKVFEVDPKFWAVDVAQRIRQSSLKASAEQVAERKLAKEGINPLKPKSNLETQRINEITDEAKRVVGQYTSNGKVGGYVTDFGDDGFTVRTPQGTVKTKTLSSPLPKKAAKEAIQTVPDDEFGHFVQTGQVSPQRIESIADKIQRQELPNSREYDIMNAKSDDVESILRRRNNNEFIQKAQTEHTDAMVNQFKKYSETLDRISKSNGSKLKFCT